MKTPMSSDNKLAKDEELSSAFLNGFINEECNVAQPLGFIDFKKPDHVYKLKKALYGLKQVPKAWYDRLKAFLIKHEYKMGMVDNTLFTKKKSLNLIIVQLYFNDIIFVSTCQDMCDEFAKIMHDEFEMSMMGELNFFLGLQIKQMEDGIFFNQSRYIKEMLKKFGLEDSKPMKTPMSFDTKLTKDEECTTHLGLWYPKGTDIETVVYADSDHAGDYVDRKSTSGICTFVGCCLTSWFSKKQTALAISTTEAEYVSAEKACQQALWMKQALIDYDIRLDDVPIMCDNKGAIDLSKNPVQHSRTKHIEIRHHFLRDNVQKGHISIEKVPSVDNIADILTKPLKRESFNYLLNIKSDIPTKRLDELAYGIPSDGPYQTNLPSIEDIISSIRIDRDGQVRRIRHVEEIDVLEYQVLTRKIEPTLKPLEEVIRENAFFWGSKNPEEIVAREEVVIPLFLLPPSINHPHLISKMNVGLWGMIKKIKLTIIPPKQLFVNISSDEDITTTPSPTTTSSSPTPLNAPSKTTSTNQTSSSQENTSSSFHSKLQISPPSSHEPTSPYHLNPLLDNILDVPPRPLNPQPLQSHPSLDITLSLSPITPLDHTHDTTSPPSPPQPQPPIMGHPLFYNYHDYHGSTCICCSHNQNLFFTLRDEMNIMFAHLEYLLTTAITLLSTTTLKISKCFHKRETLKLLLKRSFSMNIESFKTYVVLFLFILY
ncbi:retrovirus-related pol polyprotein from transposon TNT 1-94 [Tanacetum coccineum]